jgi:thiol-disulfide isomerase/thioredoxin
MPLFAGASLLSLSVTRRLSRALAIAAAAACTIAVAGCDRQKAETPQASDTAAPKSAGAQRYRIDRSGAGTALPADAVTAKDGSRVTLASLNGKPVLVNLWATWCAPCIEELPTLNRVASEVGDTGHVIALSQDLNEDPAPVHAFLEQRGWTEIASWHDSENAVGLAFGGSLPTTILFNGRGEEVVRVIGPMDWYGEEAKALLREAGFVLQN